MAGKLVKGTVKCFILMSPSLLLLFLLIELFPHTGLGRIIAVPGIMGINLTIILCALVWLRSKRRSRRIMVWTAVVLLTIMIAVGMYPQEHDPHVVAQIGKSISIVREYEEISEADLDLGRLLRAGLDSSAAELRYVVALYKYQHTLPLDGTYHLYQRESTYFIDTSIRSIDEIPEKLVGYHKVVWRYLDLFRQR